MDLVAAAAEASRIDIAGIRADFPTLSRRVANDKVLVYLDSANTSQKPNSVINAVADHYRLHNANVSRASHQLGTEATAAYELGRDRIAAFLNAPSRDEIVFSKNATESFNLIARVLSDAGRIGPNKNVVITQMEHHSNIVPWQLATERTGAKLSWLPVDGQGRLDLSDIDKIITEETAVVSLTWVSNVLGTVNPIREVIAKAKTVGALVVIDAAQAVPHFQIDLTSLGADFLVFTGHKMLGPTGIGVLWGRYELLRELPPVLGGGEMIETVTMEGSTFAAPPARFEAGTPPIAQAVGLGVAAEYLNRIGMPQIQAREQYLTALALEMLQTIDGLKILGPTNAVDRSGVLSFTLEGIHPHDVSQVLDSEGIAVRAGHHCARPVHEAMGAQASTRASLYLYTTEPEIKALVAGLEYTKQYFGMK